VEPQLSVIHAKLFFLIFSNDGACMPMAAWIGHRTVNSPGLETPTSTFAGPPLFKPKRRFKEQHRKLLTLDYDSAVKDA
jgi:hypothetical protein